MQCPPSETVLRLAQAAHIFTLCPGVLSHAVVWYERIITGPSSALAFVASILILTLGMQCLLVAAVVICCSRSLIELGFFQAANPPINSLAGVERFLHTGAPLFFPQAWCSP